MIYFVYSKQSLFIDKEVNRIVKSSVDEINDFSYVSYDLTQTLIDDIIEDAKTLPFMSENKVILVKNAYIFTNTKDKMGHNIDCLLEYIENESPTTTLIFTLNDDALDDRKQLVKIAKKRFVMKKIEETSRNDWPILIKQVLTNHKVDITSEAVQYFIDCSNNDLNKVMNEIAKFKLVNEKITIDVAKNLVSKPLDENAFGIADAIINKNVKQAFEIYNDLRVLNEEPVRLITLIAGQVRFLYQVSMYYRSGLIKEDQIARELNASPYRVKLALRKLSKADPEKLMHLLSSLATLDFKIKSGQVDRFQGFELFLLSNT